MPRVRGYLNMGLTAENLADRYGISREEQDAYALASQQKAAAAQADGRLAAEVAPSRRASTGTAASVPRPPPRSSPV